MSDVRDGDEMALSVRRALDEQTDQMFALAERNSYLAHVEAELRRLLSEARQLLLTRDREHERLRQVAQRQHAELARLRQVVQQQDAELERLGHVSR